MEIYSIEYVLKLQQKTFARMRMFFCTKITLTCAKAYASFQNQDQIKTKMI